MAMTPDPGMERDPRLAAAYHAGAHEEPPAHLDAAIRAAARREVGAAPGAAGKGRFRNWNVPMSLAAVVVLSVTMVLMMGEEGADRWDPVTPPPVSSVASMSADRAPAAPAATGRLEIVPAPALKKEESIALRQTPVESKAALPAASMELPRELAESGPRIHEQRSTNELAKVEAASRAKVAPAGIARSEEDVSAKRDEALSAPAAPPQALRRAAPSSVASEPAAGARAPGKTRPAIALADADAKVALWQDLLREPPEKWIQRIAELRRAGKIVDADALVAEFHRRFPVERLPEDLR